MGPEHDHINQHQHDIDALGVDPFDEKAATWDDDPSHVRRAQMVAERIASTLSLGSSTSMLEYGAGTGLVSEFLSSHVGAMTLADSSAGMRQVMDQKVRDGRLDQARVWDLDLSVGVVPDEKFDLIVTVLTLHHVANLQAVLESFAAMVGPGGALCIVDLDAEDGSFHGSGFAGHHGFDRSEIADRLLRAGFGSVALSDCGHVEREDGSYPMFLAIGTR